MERRETKMKNRKNTDENALYRIGWCCLGFLALLALLMRLWPGLIINFQQGCLFYKVTGFYCPGCGGTRALLALSRGQILTSLLLHPFVFYTMAVGGWFMVSQTAERLSKGRFSIGMKYRDIYLWLALAIVAVNFLVKNVLLFNGIDALTLISD